MFRFTNNKSLLQIKRQSSLTIFRILIKTVFPGLATFQAVGVTYIETKAYFVLPEKTWFIYCLIGLTQLTVSLLVPNRDGVLQS